MNHTKFKKIWESVCWLGKNITPLIVLAVTWLGISIAVVVLGLLALVLFIPVSPFIAIGVMWDFGKEPVKKWWTKQLETGMKIITRRSK
jgi:hypothetical protein